MTNLTKEQIDRAIKRIKYALALESCGSSGALWCDDVKIALTALQNELERVQGCEYCSKNEIMMFTEYEGIHGMTAHFCPMCGRDLWEVQ